MNDNELLFGAAYYEEYLPCDRLEQDMTLMAEAGMNTIRIAESTWSVEEPQCGVFDFSHVDRVIEAADRHGLKVIVGTPTYAIPSWLAKLDPEILSGNLFGARQNMDITNPTYRFYAERIIRALVSHTAGCPNVIGFQIDNETKHYGVRNERITEGFRAWLRKRFETVEAVNSAYGLHHWSLSASSFEDLPDPAGTTNGAYACAFEEYRRELATQFLAWQAGIVSALKRPDQFITHNFDYEWQFIGAEGQQDGRSAGLQPDLNDYDVAKLLTLTGTDIYFPCGDALTGKEIAFGGDLMRPLRKEPYVVLESQAQAFSGWLPYPGQLRLMALSHLASGAHGLLYWPWASLHGGLESYWKGVLSHDGEPGGTYGEVKETGLLLRRLSPALQGLRKENRIAMIVSPESLHALRRFPTDRSLGYNDIVDLFYRALYEMNLECDILYDRETDWSAYRLLVFPACYCASDEMIERVRRFVADGGSVLAGFRSFFADENAKIRPDRQPHGLTDLFGMHYDRFTKSRSSLWMELLEADAAEVISRYDDPNWGSFASAVHNRFGAGHAWYLGTIPQPDALTDLLGRVCAFAGLSVPEVRFPLICRRLLSPDGKAIRFFLNYSESLKPAAVPAAGCDLLTGSRYEKGGALSLPAWGAVILKED